MTASDDSSLREKLKRDMDRMSWSEMRRNILHQSMILVDSRLDLLAVGVAVAEDDTGKIEQWMAAGQISKPQQEHLERWEKEEPEFLGLLIPPFVLLTELGSRQ